MNVHNLHSMPRIWLEHNPVVHRCTKYIYQTAKKETRGLIQRDEFGAHSSHARATENKNKHFKQVLARRYYLEPRRNLRSCQRSRPEAEIVDVAAQAPFGVERLSHHHVAVLQQHARPWPNKTQAPGTGSGSVKSAQQQR